MKRTEGKKERKKKYRQENIVPTTLRLPSPSPLFQGMGGGEVRLGKGQQEYCLLQCPERSEFFLNNFSSNRRNSNWGEIAGNSGSVLEC